MNTLKTDINGGFPFELDDLRWIADGVAKSLEHCGNMIDDNFIIDGVTVTVVPAGLDADVTHTAGKVFFDGEFCEVDALVTPLTIPSGNVGWFAKETTFDPTGNETFEDASVNDTYQIVKVKLFQGASVPSGGIAFLTFSAQSNRIPALLVAKIVNEAIEMNHLVQFKNGATSTVVNIASGGVFEFDQQSNSQIVEFTSPVVDLIAIDSTSSDLIGCWKMITFNGTGGSTELKIVNQSAGTVGTRYLIKTRSGTDVKVLSGDVCLFWNDGTDWCLVSGGSGYPENPTLSGSWNSSGIDFEIQKSSERIVSLTGILDFNGWSVGDSLMFNVDPEYRPNDDQYLVCWEDKGKRAGRIQIRTNGDVKGLFYDSAGVLLSGVDVTVFVSGISWIAKN